MFVTDNFHFNLFKQNGDKLEMFRVFEVRCLGRHSDSSELVGNGV